MSMPEKDPFRAYRVLGRAIQRSCTGRLKTTLAIPWFLNVEQRFANLLKNEPSVLSTPVGKK
jgi:hypothetical protein